MIRADLSPNGWIQLNLESWIQRIGMRKHVIYQKKKLLVKLQKEIIITIRPCDKGAGIVVLDLNIYMRACYDHLISKQPSINNIDEEQNLP